MATLAELAGITSAARSSATPEELSGYLRERANHWGVDPRLAASVLQQESSGGRNVGISTAGARGPMQVMPETFKSVYPEGNIDNPFHNIEAGVRYLAQGQKQLNTRDPRLLAAGYYQGYNRDSLKRGEIVDTNRDHRQPSVGRYANEVAGRAGGQWGNRPDGTAKGEGFFGRLRNNRGEVMTEFSVGVNIDGREMDVPTLVPTLTSDEVETLMGLKSGEQPPEMIVRKAAAFARQRLAAGKPVFATPEESPRPRTLAELAGLQPYDSWQTRKEPAPAAPAKKDERSFWGAIADTARNVTAGTLKIGPTAVQGAIDIANMASGGRLDWASKSWGERIKAIDQVVASERLNERQGEFAKLMADDDKGVGDMFGFLLDNPSLLVDQSITTVGSMFLPIGAAGAAGKAARLKGASQAMQTKAAVATSIGTGAAQNAADTFGGLSDAPLQDRYTGAAVSFAISALMGVATGGGAEGEVARRLAGQLQAGRVGLEQVKRFLKNVGKEAIQETGEELGNIAGESVAKGQMPAASEVGKRTALAGTLGGILGGGTDLAFPDRQPAGAPATPPGFPQNPPIPPGHSTPPQQPIPPQIPGQSTPPPPAAGPAGAPGAAPTQPGAVPEMDVETVVGRPTDTPEALPEAGAMLEQELEAERAAQEPVLWSDGGQQFAVVPLTEALYNEHVRPITPGKPAFADWAQRYGQAMTHLRLSSPDGQTWRPARGGFIGTQADLLSTRPIAPASDAVTVQTPEVAVEAAPAPEITGADESQGQNPLAETGGSVVDAPVSASAPPADLQNLQNAGIEGFEGRGTAAAVDTAPPAQPAAPARRKKKSTATKDARGQFFELLMRAGGVNISHAEDITGESRKRASQRRPGLFRGTGLGIDDIATLLWENEYLTEQEYDTVDGGIQAAKDLILRALNGEQVYTLRQADEAARAAFEKRAAAEAAAADISEGDLAGVLDDLAQDEDMLDVPFDDIEAMFNADRFMIEAGITDPDVRRDIEEEALFGNEPFEQAVRRGVEAYRANAQGTPGDRADARPPGREGPPEPTGQQVTPQTPPQGGVSVSGAAQDEDLTLSTQTEESLAEDDKRRQREAAKRAKRQQEEDARAQIDQERNNFTLSGSDRPADVAMGGGQQDLLAAGSAPAPAPEDDLDAMFGDVLGEELQRRQGEGSAPAPRPRKPAAKRDAPRDTPPRTAGQAAASAAQNVGQGLNNAIDGLGALFGSRTPGRLGSGIGFDEETYAKAKPLFQAALANLKDAAGDIREAMRAVVRMVLDKFGEDAVRNMQPYVVRFIRDVRDGDVVASPPEGRDSPNQEQANVSGTNADLERDRQDAETQDGMGSEGVPDELRAGRGGDRRGDAGGGETVPGRSGSGLLSGGEASPAGERSNQPLYPGTGSAGPEGRAAGGDQSAGGNDADVSGPPTETVSTEAVDRTATKSPDIATRIEQQRKANGRKVVFGNRANIDETLPMLLEGQREDVEFAEKRFAKPNGYGVLFTNGTGTGKTFLGLGVIRRMVSAGKSHGIIVAPSQKVIEDWVKSGQLLGLNIVPLTSTQDPGVGVAITTYANFGENRTLGDRPIDFVVMDEAHTLKTGEPNADTTYLSTLRAITKHPDGAAALAKLRHRKEWDELQAANKELNRLLKVSTIDMMEAVFAAHERETDAANERVLTAKAAWEDRLKAVKQEVEESQGEKRPRAMFLSATPFAYEQNVDWANGYLFEYRKITSFAYNKPSSGFEAFMIERFGWQKRSGRLTKPPKEVDRDLLQRTFNAALRKDGVLSRRALDVPFDYDRKFVAVDSLIGTKIDRVMEWLRTEKNGRYFHLYGIMEQQFDFLNRSRLLEAIKAQAAIPYIKKHHALGRKVIVWYDYNEGGGFDLFRFQKSPNAAHEITYHVPIVQGGRTTFEERKVGWNEAIDEFNAAWPELKDLNTNLPSPLDTLTRAFPGAMQYNGKIPTKKRSENVRLFNSDDHPEANLLLVQKAANAGWSGHDTTGKHMRVNINLGLPTAPVVAIQQEGRTFRVGQASNAPHRYFNTGTTWEALAFAQRLAHRAGTAENLAAGEEARGLREAFVQAFRNAVEDEPGPNDGVGGKEADMALVKAATPWERAKAAYFAQQKRTSSTKSEEGVDYFATPEPLGLKMVEWAGVLPDDSLLEPSAGHGAIAQWFPDQHERTAIEQSATLGARLALTADAKIIVGSFENYHLNNKHDVIAMNPPFGTGGKTAFEHLEKAATHLYDGGRIVAIVPAGPAADKRLEKFLFGTATRTIKPLVETAKAGQIYRGDVVTTNASWAPKATVVRMTSSGDAVWVKVEGRPGESAVSLPAINGVESKGPRTEEVPLAADLHVVANIKLPSVTFQRAGTEVLTRVLVIEKQTDKARAGQIVQKNMDLSRVESINEFFDAIEEISLPPRATAPNASAATVAAPASAPATAAAPAGKTIPRQGREWVTHVTKKGKTLRGVVVTDVPKAQLLEIDPYAFSKDGGVFVRDQYVTEEGVDSGGALEVRSPMPARGSSFARFAQLGDDPGSPGQGLGDAMSLMGVPMKLALVEDGDLDPVVPAALNTDTGAIHWNPAFKATRAQWAQFMAEEVMHAVDVVGPRRTLSALSKRLAAGGDIREEANAVFESGRGAADWLAYPLHPEAKLNERRIQAELFARLAVFYHGDPARLRRELPISYEAIHELFGAAQLDAETYVLRAVRGGDPGSDAAAGGEGRADARPDDASGRGAQRGQADRRLAQLRDSIARVFRADRAGGLVDGRLESRDQQKPYEQDLFGNPIPAPRRTDAGARPAPAAAGRPDNLDAPAPIQLVTADDALPGVYRVTTAVVEERRESLPVDRVTTPEDAARAFGYLGRNAVERLDGLVTDAKGKPLALVGGFKGATAVTSWFPETMISEAFRIKGAANLWMGHNHPSGTSDLSQADINSGKKLFELLDGSGITMRGMLAVGANGSDVRFSFIGYKNDFDPVDLGSRITEQRIFVGPDVVTAPLVNRVITNNERLDNEAIASPTDLERFVTRVTTDKPALLLLTNQHAPVALVGLDQIQSPLRQGGRMDALYRSLSMANAGAAVIINPNGAMTARHVENVGNFLASAGLRVLDAVSYQYSPSTKAYTAFNSYAMQGRDVATGGGFFSRGTQSRGMPAAQVQSAVDALRRRWTQAPEIVVVRNMSDPAVPEAVRRENLRQLSAGADGVPRGFFYGGKVYLVAEGLGSMTDVAEVAFHEVLGHFGLRGAFGDALNRVLGQVGVARPDLMRKKATEYGFALTLKDAIAAVNAERAAAFQFPLTGAALESAAQARLRADRLAAAEEVLAEIAQTRPNLGLVRRAVAAIRTWLRENIPGFRDLKLTDDEIIRNYILPARAWVERGQEAARPGARVFFQRVASTQSFKETERAYGGRSAYERAKAAGKTKLTYGQWVQVRTPEFKAWLGDWEIAATKPRRDAQTFEQARAAAGAFQGKPLTNLATGIEAVVSRNSLDKMLSGKAVSKSETPQAHALAVANLDDMFSRALLGWSKPDAGSDPNIKAIHRFFAPVVRNERTLLAKMTVKETAIAGDPNPLYTVEAVEFNEESPAAQWVAAASDADGVDLTSIRSAGDIETLAQRVQDFNPDTVSKVVDPDTGEPLVVYHGTGADDITVFNSPLVWASADPALASGYAEAAGDLRDGQANVMPLYAKTSAPFDADADSDKGYMRIADLVESAIRQAAQQGHPVSKADADHYRRSMQLAWSRFGLDDSLVDTHHHWSVVGRVGTLNLRDMLQSMGFDGIKYTEDSFMNGKGISATTYAVFKPEQIKSAIGNRGTFDRNNDNILFQRAFHGTPHRGITKFSTDYVGAGEGSQWYGWGLYFASRREVAEHYRKTLSRDSGIVVAGKTVRLRDYTVGTPQYDAVAAYVYDFNAGRTANDALSSARSYLAQIASMRPKDAHWKRVEKDVKAYVAVMERWFAAGVAANPGGQLYEVDIPEDSEMLDWDKPLSEMPEALRDTLRSISSGTSMEQVLAGKDVQALLKWVDGIDHNNSFNEMLDENPEVTADEVREAIIDAYGEYMDEYLADTSFSANQTGESIYLALRARLGDDRAASKALHAAGIKGIRYLDRDSRRKGEGSHNYVIFDGADVQITGVMFSRGRPSAAPPGPSPQQPLPNVPQAPQQAGLGASGGAAPPAGPPVARTWGPQAPLPLPAWTVDEPSRLDNILYSLQNKLVDTKRVIEAIKEWGLKVSDWIDPYLHEELYHGRVAKRTQEFLQDELKPLLAQMRLNGVTIPDFEEFLHNRHAEERNDQIARINPNMPDAGSGIASADARAYLAGLDPKKRQVFDRLAQKIDAITAETRQILIGYGLESPSTIAAWDAAYKSYVPLQREDMETGFSGNGTGSGFSVRGPSSRRATGSLRNVVDILGNLALQRERAIARGEKNRVATALWGLAKSAPAPDFWKVDKPPMIKTVNPATGLVDQYADPNFKSRDNVIVARIPDPRTGEVHERAVIFNERSERALRMARSLKNLDADQLGWMLDKSRLVTRYFASINTQFNPIFGIVNFLRDVQGAAFNLSSTPLAGKQAQVAAMVLPALRGIYKDQRAVRAGSQAAGPWSTLWEEFQKEGGQTGYRDMWATGEERAKALEDELRALGQGRAMRGSKAILGWLSDYNEAIENSVRLATYKAGLDAGLTKQRAASVAKNITVNFNRKGQMATQAGALYAFFNAGVQGTTRMVETLRGPAGRQIIGGGLLLGAMQAFLLAAAGYDDDEPPQFVRERNLIMPLPGQQYVSIPMPLGLHVLPNTGRLATEFFLSGMKDPSKRVVDWLAMMAESFNPLGNAGLSMQTLTPTPLDPVAALAENKDWTGKPIYREDINKREPTPGFTRNRDTATPWSRGLAYALNFMSGGTDFKPGAVSPTADAIDFLIGQATGGVGREVSKVAQMGESLATGEDLPPYKIPLVGRLYGTTDGQSSQANRFYANLQRLAEHEAEIKGRSQVGGDVRGYLADNPEAKLWRQANQLERSVSELRRRKRAAIERGASKEEIRGIDNVITERMKTLNEAMAAEGAR